MGLGSWFKRQSYSQRSISAFYNKHSQDAVYVIDYGIYKSVRDDLYKKNKAQERLEINKIFKAYRKDLKRAKDVDQISEVVDKQRKRVGSLYFKDSAMDNNYQNVVDFDYLVKLFPYAAHGALEHYIRFGRFFEICNIHYRDLYINTYQEHALEIVDLTAEKKAFIEYYFKINKEIVTLYRWSQQKIIDQINSARINPDPEKKFENFSQVKIDNHSVPNAEQKVKQKSYDAFVTDVANEFYGILKKYTKEKKQKKLFNYLLSIISKANSKKVSLHMGSILKVCGKRFGTRIDNIPQVISLLDEISEEYGFQSSIKFVERLQKRVEEKLKLPQKSTFEVLKDKIQEGATDDEIVEFFKSSRFVFLNEKRFRKQMVGLLTKTSDWKKKRKKFISELNRGDAIWHAQQGYFVMKFSFGSDQIRVLRNGNIIENILNHDEYERIYRNVMFG